MFKQFIVGFLTLFLVFVFSPAYPADTLVGSEMMRSEQMMRSGQMMDQASSPQKMGMQQPAGGYVVWYCPQHGAFMNPKMMGQGWGITEPGMMGNMMSPAMMSNMMQPGIMGNMMSPVMMGNMMQPGLMGQGMQGNASSLPVPLTKEGVRIMMEYKLHFLIRNPNLKLGKIKEVEEGFEVQIVTRDDSLVNRFVLDRNTGMMTPKN